MLSKEVQSAAILTAARFDVEKSLKFVFLKERGLNFIFQNIYKSNAARFNGILENRVKRRNLQKFQSLNSLLQHSQIQYWEIPGTQITKEFFLWDSHFQQIYESSPLMSRNLLYFLMNLFHLSNYNFFRNLGFTIMCLIKMQWSMISAFTVINGNVLAFYPVCNFVCPCISDLQMKQNICRIGHTLVFWKKYRDMFSLVSSK